MTSKHKPYKPYTKELELEALRLMEPPAWNPALPVLMPE